jgi:hypothetical protein
MHHTKFEKNWSISNQEEVKNIQMLTDTIVIFGLALGAKPLLRGL